MNLKNIITVLLILMLFIISIGSISAETSSDLNLNEHEINDISNDIGLMEITEQPKTNEIETDRVESDDSPNINKIDSIEKENNDKQLKSDENDHKVWYIYADKKNPNQILNPTVQPVIDNASAGDIIILSGTFIHCHFEVSKNLTIIATNGTSVTPCPHHELPIYSGMHGVFYISPEASGTVIENFTFLNTNYNIANEKQNPFAVYVDGAKDVELRNFIINWKENPISETDNNPEDFIFNPILLRNAENVLIENIYTNHTINGIRIENSSDIIITNSNITGSRFYGILIDDLSSDINIENNIIENNLIGINSSSGDNINVLRNIIRNNELYGINFNSNISFIDIESNLFSANNLHAVHYEYTVKNLNNDTGDDEKAIIDYNIFTGHTDMIIHHTIYVEDNIIGDYIYNENNDTYTYVGIGNGNYSQDKGFNYMRYALVLDGLVCGHSFITTTVPWDSSSPKNNGKYNFSLGVNLSQNKNGVYNFSITDAKGNVAEGFNDLEVLFLLNEYNNTITSQEGVYKLASIKNGSAVADFSDSIYAYKNTGNKITAVLLGISDRVNLSPNYSLDINDSDIPKEQEKQNTSTKIRTKLTLYKLNTYPLSDAYLKVKLTKSDGKAVAGKKISFKINGKTYTANTDKSGIAKVKINLIIKKTYKATVKFAGDNSYKAVSNTGTITVKTGTKKAKITSSNVKVKRNAKKTYQLKLTTSAGKAIKSAKVKITVNGKTYTKTTDSKGIAKISIKLSKVKTYAIKMQYLGNLNYKAVTKTNKITVTKK